MVDPSFLKIIISIPYFLFNCPGLIYPPAHMGAKLDDGIPTS